MVRKQLPPHDSQIASPLGYRTEVDKLATKARFTIKIIGGALALLFTWIQLKDFPVVPLLESTKAGFVLRLALAVYYFSWIFGTSFDVSVQQSVYVRDADRGHLGWRAIAAIGLFGATAAIFLWASDDEKWFAATLTGFIIANIIGWLVLVRRVTSIIYMSLLTYDQDFFEIERLHVVKIYIAGNWQKYRFLVMFAIALVAIAISFVAPVRLMVSLAIASLVFGLKETVISPLLPSLVFVVFLVIAEGWIWMMRAKTWASLNLISDLKEKYQLEPIRPRTDGP